MLEVTNTLFHHREGPIVIIPGRYWEPEAADYRVAIQTAPMAFKRFMPIPLNHSVQNLLNQLGDYKGKAIWRVITPTNPDSSDRCQVKSCRREAEFEFYGYPVCAHHWDLHCNPAFRWTLHKEFAVAAERPEESKPEVKP